MLNVQCTAVQKAVEGPILTAPNVTFGRGANFLTSKSSNVTTFLHPNITFVLRILYTISLTITDVNEKDVKTFRVTQIIFNPACNMGNLITL